MRGGGLVFAVDVADVPTAEAAVRAVGDAVDMVKVGLELFVLAGPAVMQIGDLIHRPVFLDLKLHDIPETVDRAVARACGLGASFLTVHASGGTAMLERAVSRAEKEGSGLTIVAVTVLTSLDERDLGHAGVSGGVEAQVVRLARLAWSAGVRAFVSSPREVSRMRTELGPTAVLITPGIRAASSEVPSGRTFGDDQKRVATATQAVRDGANWLVVGRPIRDAESPRAAALAFGEEIAKAQAARAG